jgi:hypothetical protein
MCKVVRIKGSDYRATIGLNPTPDAEKGFYRWLIRSVV